MKIFNTKLFWIAIVIIFLIVNVLIIIFSAQVSDFIQKIISGGNNWYAITLNDGKIYFGHIKDIDDNSIKLSDVYYLEEYQAEQASALGNENFQIQNTPEKKYALVKRGSERIDATDNTMFINRSNVLFWEKLLSDSEIVSKIREKEK